MKKELSLGQILIPFFMSACIAFTKALSSFSSFFFFVFYAHTCYILFSSWAPKEISVFHLQL